MNIPQYLRPLCAAIMAGLVLAGCATMGGNARVIGRSDRFLVVVPGEGATSRSLASSFLGDADKYWMIEDANEIRQVRPGHALVIPRRPWNPAGADLHGHQTVPILAYHNIGRRAAAMTVTPDMFRRQMQYLQEHHYRVIPLAHLIGFLDGTRQLPERAVVITFDDGYQSVYKTAFPILQQYGYPATLFVYSDYMDHGGVTKAQLREMTGSGIFTVLPHSKTHGNLALRLPGEDEGAYRKRLQQEIVTPRRVLDKVVSGPMFGYAYPYGDANPEVLEMMRKEGYTLGATVLRGSNSAYAPPLLLRRTMIFGTRDMQRFASALKVYKKGPAK